MLKSISQCIVIVFEGRALERWLCHEGEVLTNGIGVLIKEIPFVLRSAMWGSKMMTGCEQQAGHHQTSKLSVILNLSVTWSWTSHHQSCERRAFCGLKPSVCGPLLCHPWESEYRFCFSPTRNSLKRVYSSPLHKWEGWGSERWSASPRVTQRPGATRIPDRMCLHPNSVCSLCSFAAGTCPPVGLIGAPFTLLLSWAPCGTCANTSDPRTLFLLTLPLPAPLDLARGSSHTFWAPGWITRKLSPEPLPSSRWLSPLYSKGGCQTTVAASLGMVSNV